MATHEEVVAADVTEDVNADVEDDADAVCESLGEDPTMLTRTLPVGLEAVDEVVSEHGETVTVVVQITRLDGAEDEAVNEPDSAVPPADWGSAMSAGYAKLATGWRGTLSL